MNDQASTSRKSAFNDRMASSRGVLDPFKAPTSEGTWTEKHQRRTFHLSLDVWEEINERAASGDESKSAIVEMALRQFFGMEPHTS